MSATPQPVPFEIFGAAEDGVQVATNGSLRLAVRGAGGRVFRRRGISGLALKPPAETLIPRLNELAGELLQRPDMPAPEAVSRLLAMVGMVPTAEPKRSEWAVAELNGVRVYTDGVDVIVTTEDMRP